MASAIITATITVGISYRRLRRHLHPRRHHLLRPRLRRIITGIVGECYLTAGDKSASRLDYGICATSM